MNTSPNSAVHPDAREDRPLGGDAARPPKPCACSGVRSCARCLAPDLRRAYKMDDPLPLPPLLTAKPPSQEALLCQPITTEHGTMHAFDPVSQSVPNCPVFSGLRLYPEAISKSEEEELIKEIEQRPFTLAQSGKWKQHFGARINFNKRRMNPKDFHGLPHSAKQIEDIARNCIQADSTRPEECIRALASFKTTDYFTLRYFEEEGSNLDFHRDDRFGYGEAILDLSLESDSVLTFIRPRPRAHPRRAPQAPSASASDSDEKTSKPAPPKGPIDCVRVPLPARSVALLYGPARFEWEHAILARDIQGQRTSITLRTLSEEIRETESGRQILAIAEMRI